MLSQVFLEFNRLSDMFELVDPKHICRERNSHVDILAKDGAMVLEGFWHIKEFRDAENNSYTLNMLVAYQIAGKGRR